MRAGWLHGCCGVSDSEMPRREAFDAGIGQESFGDASVQGLNDPIDAIRFLNTKRLPGLKVRCRR
jgi:hypothetical protein